MLIGLILITKFTYSQENLSCVCSVLAKCTDSNGDELDSCPVCDDPDDLECFPNLGGCPVDDSMYNYHDFNENDDGMVTAQVVPQEAQKGQHCVLKLDLLQNQCKYGKCIDRGLREVNIKYKLKKAIMDNLPINNYGLLYSPGECYSREEAKEIIKERFFNPLPVEEQEEENIQVCCPSYEVWKKYYEDDMILDANSSITPEYRNEFEKCSQPEFVEFGDFEIEAALKTYPVPLFYRLSFWIPTIFIIFALIFAFLFYCCLAQIQQRIERNKKSQFALLENQVEPPYCFMEDENMLGQGGGGTVYEGKYDGIDVAIKKIVKWDTPQKFISLRNECIIQHAFKHDYILDIFYPPVAAIVQPDTASIETIVVSKYGWGKTTEGGREKRNLFDLLMEIREKSTCSVNYGVITGPEWSQAEVNTVAWDIVKSLLKGLQNLHEGKTCDTSGNSFPSKFKSVVHRDIKLKNIGVKRNADGHFYAVIADFGLSSVLLDADAFVTDSNRCLKQRFKNGIEKKLKRLPDWMDWFKYLINLKSIDIDQEVLRLIKDRENVSVKGFLEGRGCGTDNWTAPEIVRKRQSTYFFQLNTNYNCKRCFKAKSADQGSSRGSSGRRNRQFTGDFQRADVCTKCRAKIFEFYRKNDIYSTGLVLWSILKAVLGSFTGFHTENDTGVASYLDHPLDATTSLDQCEFDIDESEVANLLINEIKKESRKNEIDKINDLRISKIRDLTERCLNPNPFERPEAVMLYEEVELLNIELESSLADQPFS